MGHFFRCGLCGILKNKRCAGGSDQLLCNTIAEYSFDARADFNRYF